MTDSLPGVSWETGSVPQWEMSWPSVLVLMLCTSVLNVPLLFYNGSIPGLPNFSDEVCLPVSQS